MQITLIPGEPLGTAIARFAADCHQHAGREIKRLVPGRVGAYVGFALPLHLNDIAARLPAKIGATAEWLAEKFTGYPAIAPLLEEPEQKQLLDSMARGKRVGHFPICHGREFTAAKPQIRYCPVCVARDRDAMGFGALRMWHNLHGISACADHGCRLEEVNCGFNDNAVLGDADEMVGAVMPEPVIAGVAEVQVAADVMKLFFEGCARPGRRRAAHCIKQALIERGYSIRGELDEARLLADIGARYPETLASMYAEPIPLRLSSWRQCYAPAPRLYPVVKLAVLARLADAPLGTLLESARATALAQIEPQEEVRHYGLSPRDRTRVAREKKPSQPRRNWGQIDSALAERVRFAARINRACAGRPRWISAVALTRVVGAFNWRRPELWRGKLPQFHNALVEESDTPVGFAVRALTWTLEEIRAGRQRRYRGFHCFLQAARLTKLADKYPAIASAAQRFFLEQAPLGEQLALFASEAESREAAA